MTQPINVVIPTRERADTLLHALATVVAEDCDRLRIWVSDNASSPATREVVESFADPRITYLNTGQRLSMAHNYEFALSHIANGWIVMIGDDDGLVPGRLQPAVERLEDSGLEAMNADPCYYNWPGAVPEVLARLVVPLGTDCEVLDAKAAMAFKLRLHRTAMRLPQTYTSGIVHAGLYSRIKAVRGSFFQSQIPDIFSGFAICSVIDAFLYDRNPFALAGRSPHSIGTALFNVEKNAFLDEGLIPFHPDFPMPEAGTLTFSMPAIFFEGYTQAAYLHHGDPPLDRQTMLERILALTNHGREQLAGWGRRFADLHGLDLAAAERAQSGLQRRRTLAEFPHRAANFANTARVFAGDPRPHANVMEAALTAAAILNDPPNRLIEAGRSLLTYARSPGPIR